MSNDPRPPDVLVELNRVVRRWQQLPLDRAVSLSGEVRASAQHLLTAASCTDELPEVSPAATIDQLRVVVFDVCASGCTAAVVGDALVGLRRRIG